MARTRRVERGLVTVELAMSVLAALLLVAMFSAVIAVLALQMACTDTAGEVARQVARGDEAAAAEARREAPRGARVSTSRSGDRVVVEVRLPARPLGDVLPAVPLRARAEVTAEPGQVGSP